MTVEARSDQLHIPESATVDTPLAGTVALWADSGSQRLALMDSDGISHPINEPIQLIDNGGSGVTLEGGRIYVENGMARSISSGYSELSVTPRFHHGRYAVINGFVNAVTAHLTNVATTGTLTGSALVGSTVYSQSTSAASIGATASFFSTPSFSLAYGQIVFHCYYRHFAANTTQREWVGLFDSLASINADTLSGIGLGFRFSTVASDTTWKAVFGTAVVDTGVAVTASAANFLMRIRVADSSNAYFSIDNGAEVHVTRTGSAPQFVGFGCCMIAQAASARSLAISRMMIEYV